MNNFDSIQVRFENTEFFPSPLANTKVVPFVDSYFEILKSVVNDVKTEYFWFFSGFINMKNMDMDYIPEQHEKDQIHVWYNTHPKGGTNKEGNVMLVPTKKFKEQMGDLQYLSDFKDINYHMHSNLYQAIISKIAFDLSDLVSPHNQNEQYYSWLFNVDLASKLVPNFYPSFWEGVKIYSWGATKDIMLVPKQTIENFHDIKQQQHFELEYPVKKMDVVDLKEDSALGYVDAAARSTTGYFFIVPPGGKIPDNFDFNFQPDRMAKPSHYIFDGPVYLCNKKICLDVKNPGFDPRLAIKL